MKGTDRPPNILLVWTDQQRNDTLPCLGNTFVQAPNLKRLGEYEFRLSPRRLYPAGLHTIAGLHPDRAAGRTPMAA